MPKFTFKILLILIFSSSHFFIYSQSREIEGVLLDSLRKRGIQYAQVYNESSKTNTITDSLGNFHLKGKTGDTLVFLSMGYFGKIYIVKDLSHNSVLLMPRPYEIEPVIISTPRNYHEFKKAFLEVKTDTGLRIDGFPRYIPKLMPDLLDTNIIGSTAFAIQHPISYIYYKYSKEEKSKRKVLYLKKEEREQVVIDQKFSRDLIAKLTGLQDKEITEFIAFCNFTHIYLFESTDYEIVEAITKKYEEYKQLQK